MAIEILMPALSPTMEEGKLAKWLVKEGDTVTSGQIIAEIETDKATMEFEAVDEGTIVSIAVDEGTEGADVAKHPPGECGTHVSLDAADEGIADLPADQESQSSAAAPGSREA